METISSDCFWMFNSLLCAAKGQMLGMWSRKPRHLAMALCPTNAAMTTWTSTRTSTPSTSTTTPTVVSPSVRTATLTCRWWGVAITTTARCTRHAPRSRPTRGLVTDAAPTKVREMHPSCQCSCCPGLVHGCTGLLSIVLWNPAEIWTWMWNGRIDVELFVKFQPFEYLTFLMRCSKCSGRADC